MYSPTFAGDIRQVQEHYVDEQADLLEECQFDEESHPELDIEMDFSEKLIDREERDGPPTVDGPGNNKAYLLRVTTRPQNKTQNPQR